MLPLKCGPSTDEPRPPTTSNTSNTMKLPQVLRRGSALDVEEVKMEKDTRRGSLQENQRKSSLSSLPLRMRRRKTLQANKDNEQETAAAKTLGRLLFSLPSEIITQTIVNLSIHDIYNLRLTSRSFNAILNYNGPSLAREILPHHLAPHTTSYIQPCLYPPAPPPSAHHGLGHLLTMLRRQHVIDQQIFNLLAFVQMKIYMTRTATRVLSVSDNRQRLIDAFQRPAWFVTHFLERYRAVLIHEHPSHPSPATNAGSCPQCRDAARRVVATYPPADILPAYHFYQLALEHLQIATRAPMAAGSLERRLRGWPKVSMTDENLAIFVVLGGVPEIRKVAMMQGSFNSRMAFVGEFVEKVRRAVDGNAVLAEIIKDRRGGLNPAPVLAESSEARTESVDLEGSMSPPFAMLTQEHIKSLPDVSTFFYDIWKDRVSELVQGNKDVSEPYPWLQQVMAGSGLDFGQLRSRELSLALGASPV